MVGTILLIVLVLLVLGALPQSPFVQTSDGPRWGYGPSSGLGIALIILFVLLIAGRI